MGKVSQLLYQTKYINAKGKTNFERKNVGAHLYELGKDTFNRMQEVNTMKENDKLDFKKLLNCFILKMKRQL